MKFCMFPHPNHSGTVYIALVREDNGNLLMPGFAAKFQNRFSMPYGSYQDSQAADGLEARKENSCFDALVPN